MHRNTLRLAGGLLLTLQRLLNQRRGLGQRLLGGLGDLGHLEDVVAELAVDRPKQLVQRRFEGRLVKRGVLLAAPRRDDSYSTRADRDRSTGCLACQPWSSWDSVTVFGCAFRPRRSPGPVMAIAHRSGATPCCVLLSLLGSQWPHHTAV